MSNALFKYLDELLFQLPDLMKIKDGERKLTAEDGTALYRLRRYEEVTRIVETIQEVYGTLEENKREFLSFYYWGSVGRTLESTAREIHIDRKTAIAWKKEITRLIARRLGWI